jgi:hypothetical protein
MMSKPFLKALAAAVLLSAFALDADAAPQWIAEGALAPAPAAHPAYSPVPPALRRGTMLIEVRDPQQMRGSGNACWNHCFSVYDECMGLKAKNICLSQIKVCMETCDRLSGMTNPTQRASTTER